MAAYRVSFLGDMNLRGSPRRCFGLLRMELIEGLGCGELAVFLEDALILQGILAQLIDTECFIFVLLSVWLQ
jgi:hypothetical protein